MPRTLIQNVVQQLDRERMAASADYESPANGRICSLSVAALSTTVGILAHRSRSGPSAVYLGLKCESHGKFLDLADRGDHG